MFTFFLNFYFLLLQTVQHFTLFGLNIFKFVMIEINKTGITYLLSSTHSQHQAMQQLRGIVIETNHYKTQRSRGKTIKLKCFWLALLIQTSCLVNTKTHTSFSQQEWLLIQFYGIFRILRYQLTALEPPFD